LKAQQICIPLIGRKAAPERLPQVRHKLDVRIGAIL